MIKLNINYILLSIVILLIEFFIEKTTGFVRYTLGDVFAVMFVYTAIKSVLNVPVIKAAILALSVAFTIEFLQLSSLQDYYPEDYKKLFGLFLGSSFSIGDLIAYACGITVVLILEWRLWNLFYYVNFNED